MEFLILSILQKLCFVIPTYILHQNFKKKGVIYSWNMNIDQSFTKIIYLGIFVKFGIRWSCGPIIK